MRPPEPLGRTIADAPALSWLRVVRDAPAGLPPGLPADEPAWEPAAELTGERLDALVAAAREHLAQEYAAGDVTLVPERVAAAHLLCWYLGAVAVAGALPFVHGRRVPRLRPEDLAVQWDPQGWPVAVAVLSPTYACLPDDADAGHPAAVVVDGLEALRARLREEVAGHAAAFLAAWGRRGGRGRRTLWGFVGDALVDALVEVAGEGAGEEAGDVGGRGAEEAAAVLPPGGAARVAPLVGEAVFERRAAADGGWEVVRRRTACCLAYALPAGTECTSCPRRAPEPQRQDRHPVRG